MTPDTVTAADLELLGPFPENAVPVPPDVLYPESDGERMGESWWHMVVLAYLLDALLERFGDAPDVFVTGDMFLYYEEGRPASRVAPDIMVVKGVANRPRSSYLLWQERVVPCCTVEILSPRSLAADLDEKREVYQRLGVAEYVIVDPLEGLHRPPLTRFHRAGGDGKGSFVREAGDTVACPDMGLRLAVEDGRIRAYDLVTGTRYLYASERREAEAARRAAGEAERQARAAAEAEIARLRAEIERLKGGGQAGAGSA